MTSALLLLAVVVLGLTAGALLAEGAVLVPFWRSLHPSAFLAWYRGHAALLVRFFGPLEVAAALLVILAALTSWLSGKGEAPLLAASALLACLVLAAFPLYFGRANARFAEGTIEADRVAEALRRWALWHWARVVVATAAFLVALLAAMSPRPAEATSLQWKTGVVLTSAPSEFDPPGVRQASVPMGRR